MAEQEASGAGFSSVGLVIGLPLCGRATTPLWGISVASQTYPLNTSITYCVIQNEEVGVARNQIVDFALEHKATYVFFLDDDVLLPAHAVQRLGYALDQKRLLDEKFMVCAGVYTSKEDPSTPVIYQDDGKGAFWKWKLGDVFEIKSAGTGAMLISTDLFEHLEKPYFKTVEEYVPPSIPDGAVGVKKITDDLYFCKKVREAGFKLLAHGGVLCGHYDLKSNRIFGLPEDSYPVVAAREAEKARETPPA